mgnify:CR=1 FL=1|jgi:hypothetical protein
MENLNNEIVTLVIENNVIQIRYDNDTQEEIEIDEIFYSNMRNLWLISQPPFISDRYKNVMNDIILACIHKNKRCISELNNFFAKGNEDSVKDFLTYMRKRDLTEEKKKWKII